VLIVVGILVAVGAGHPVVADAINGAKIRIESDQGTWTSSVVAFDASSAQYGNPSSSTMRFNPDGGAVYFGAEVPADCSGEPIRVITEPPRIVVGELSCGLEAAREYVNFPLLTSTPILEEPGWTRYSARYAAAYGQIFESATQVRFDWWINHTGTGDVHSQWHPGWQSLTTAGNVKYAIPTPPIPANWLVTCPGAAYRSEVTITTNDGWSVKDTSGNVARVCI
jgi:hypothetical protein